jgi:BASS family bile acid:Na+ symporter
MLLVAACPIGGISNTYSYLARASTALSVTLTALSCLCASVTIPIISKGLEMVVGSQFDFSVPLPLLFAQLTLMLALPVGVGMWIRHRWPDFAMRHRPALQRVAFIGLFVLLAGIILDNPGAFVDGIGTTASLAAVFVILSFGVGWVTATLLTADDRDRFTVAAEFGTRNLGVALAVAVMLLGRVEFGRFVTAYALVEIPILLCAVAAFRKYVAQRAPAPTHREALQE